MSKINKISDELLERMKIAGYEPEAIEYARRKLKDEKDLKFAMGLLNNLTFMEIGNMVFKMVEEGKIKPTEGIP